MFTKLFSQVNLLERSLDASSLRQQTIAQNMANADTPNYKSKRVVFEEALRSAIDNQQSGFQNFRTNERHIVFEGYEDPSSITASVVTDDHYTMRMDGNNVDPDQQMTNLAKNTIQYDLLTTKLNAELARIKMAIREGK